jgi:hypothetical protein
MSSVVAALPLALWLTSQRLPAELHHGVDVRLRLA